MTRHASLNIWTNAVFPDSVSQLLHQGLTGHQVVVAQKTSSLNLTGAPPDERLQFADIAFGQPDAVQLMQLERIKWVHLTTAGYTNYDRDDLKQYLKARRIPLTTSSGVYDDPCAQHVMSMMMAFARQLPQSFLEQNLSQGWPAAIRRRNSFLLNGQSAVLVGYGEIAKRLCDLLKPFQMKLTGVRRQPRGDELIPTVPIANCENAIRDADHVINLLPANDSTQQFFDAHRLACLKPEAYFYNIGRGSTVDQDALRSMLENERIAGAYLDVTAVEPLPSDHPLWRTRNCFITPHTAGGFREEMHALVAHFLQNLQRFLEDKELRNRVI